jgi:hypothetical protein
VTSQEKLLAFKDWLLAQEPPDEQTRIVLAILTPLLPVIFSYLPSEPEELDALLRRAAWAAVNCRSDEAQVVELFDGVEFSPEDGGGVIWQPVRL